MSSVRKKPFAHLQHLSIELMDQAGQADPGHCQVLASLKSAAARRAVRVAISLGV